MSRRIASTAICKSSCRAHKAVLRRKTPRRIGAIGDETGRSGARDMILKMDEVVAWSRTRDVRATLETSQQPAIRRFVYSLMGRAEGGQGWRQKLLAGFAVAVDLGEAGTEDDRGTATGRDTHAPIPTAIVRNDTRSLSAIGKWAKVCQSALGPDNGGTGVAVR